MMAQVTPTATTLQRLPRSEQAPSEILGLIDSVPPLLNRLSGEGFNGMVTVISPPHLLDLLLLDGAIVGASLRSTVKGPQLSGLPALKGFQERAGANADTRAQCIPLPRPVTECLTADLDVQPAVATLNDTANLREALRQLAGQAHHGIAELHEGESWARVLFNKGQVIGAYDSQDATVVSSLAALGRILVKGPAMLTVRKAGSPARLTWPPISMIDLPAASPSRLPKDDARDDRIENNLVWLLSNVDRDRERASTKGSNAEAQVLQVLASFVNSIYGVASQLTSSSPVPQKLASLRELATSMRTRYPLMGELEVSADKLDVQNLVKRYRALPKESAPATEFYAGMARSLLALAQHSAGVVVQEVADSAASLRCATSVEAWLFSVEMSLPSPSARTGVS
jgi:hypothetical protein